MKEILSFYILKYPLMLKKPDSTSINVLYKFVDFLDQYPQIKDSDKIRYSRSSIEVWYYEYSMNEVSVGFKFYPEFMRIGVYMNYNNINAYTYCYNKDRNQINDVIESISEYIMIKS